MINGLDIFRTLRDSDSNTNLYYEDTGIGLSLRQKFLEKFILTLGGIYSNNDYNAPAGNSREDDIYKASVDLKYRIQDWLNAGIGYNYWKQDSNYRVNDFTDNQFKISLGVVY